MVMDIYLFGEVHPENVFNKLAPLNKLLNGFLSEVDKYLDQDVDLYCKKTALEEAFIDYTKSVYELIQNTALFYEQVNNLLNKGRYSVFFLEGSQNKKEDLFEAYVFFRGLFLNVFDHLYCLDKEGYEKENDQEREKNWVEVLNQELSKHQDAVVIISCGFGHLEPNSMINPNNLREHLNITDFIIHEPKVMDLPLEYLESGRQLIHLKNDIIEHLNLLVSKKGS